MKYIKILNIFLLALVIYTTHTFVESITIERQLKEFKETANVLVYELDEEINFTFKQNDILLNRKSGYRNLFVRDIISFFTGGHSALVID